MGEQLLIHYENVEICRQEQIVLRNVNMKLYAGEFVYFIGKVGSGKSSLLKTIYGEIPISDGEASVLDYDIKRLKRREIPYLRRKIGVVFQDFQLLTDRSVFENLQFVLKATGWTRKQEIADRIEEVLHQVGMHTKAYKMPHELSGGEQQRIVIARSLLNSPQLILADEPTGNLDPETGRTIVALLHNICHTGTAVIMTTHNHHLVKEFPGRLLKCENRHLHEVEENNE